MMDEPIGTPFRGSSRKIAPRLAEALEEGILVLRSDGGVELANDRALRLLGCAEAAELDRLWQEILPRLEAQGLKPGGSEAVAPGEPGGGRETGGIDLTLARLAPQAPLAPNTADEVRLHFDLERGARGRSLVRIRRAGLAEALAGDLCLAAQMRSISQITPGVAHDLRAPINAMVLNLEVLKETLLATSAETSRERLLRYVGVVSEELGRLHRGLETFISQASPRSDRVEELDLRTLVSELGSLLVPQARKIQARVEVELPDGEVRLTANSYLLRQALLHLGLATLGELPRQGALRLRLETSPGRVLLLLTARPGPADGTEAAGPAARPAGPFSGQGHPEAGKSGRGVSGPSPQLEAASELLAGQGAEVRRGTPSREAPSGEGSGFEVDFSRPPQE